MNAGHVAIAKFQEHCINDKKMESMLVTQNIDDLHNRTIRESPILSKAKDNYCVRNDDNRVAFTPHVYEIHGSVHYMHCSQHDEDHSKVFFKGPTIAEFEAAYEAAPEKKITAEDGTQYNFCLVPKCGVCGAAMKPHSMFFDETYNEHFYRRDTVMNFVEKSDCLIVVGTALATNLAKQIVCKFLDKELPVIEVNLESAIDRGYNLQVLQGSELALPELFEEYYRLKKQAAVKPMEEKKAAQGRLAAQSRPKDSRSNSRGRVANPRISPKASKGKKGVKKAAAKK